ncbi:MAG: P22 coat protein - protein 5 domain protein, partial [Clostridia bacterium]|nr:P22 coat protein - protein 5 domain protein [Clostridia bacterium]
MAITSFIPSVWSARLTENLHKSLVFGSLCNRNYEGDIAQFGDTVHINNLADITVKPYTPNTDIAEPEQLTGSDTTLTIDHGAYYNF